MVLVSLSFFFLKSALVLVGWHLRNCFYTSRHAWPGALVAIALYLEARPDALTRRICWWALYITTSSHVDDMFFEHHDSNFSLDVHSQISWWTYQETQNQQIYYSHHDLIAFFCTIGYDRSWRLRQSQYLKQSSKTVNFSVVHFCYLTLAAVTTRHLHETSYLRNIATPFAYRNILCLQ